MTKKTIHKHHDLEPGLYVLTRDVVNGESDGRKKDTWSCWPVWKRGSRFRVRKRTDVNDYGDGVEITHTTTMVMMVSGVGHETYVRRFPWGEIGDRSITEDFKDALEHVELKSAQDVTDLYDERSFGYHKTILHHIVDSGLVTVAQFESLFKQCVNGEGPFSYEED